MFIGHFALGLAAKKVEPRLSLGLAFLAVQLLDLVWPLLVLLGIERVAVEPGATEVTPLDFQHYPWSHSLAMTLVWSGLLAGLVFWRGRSGRVALWAGLLVASHWVLDWLTHRPDLPLAPGTDWKVGLGLWGSRAGTLVLEGALFVAGLVLYVRAARATVRRRPIAFWSLMASLVVIYFSNLFGPPPPPGAPAAMVAGPALAMWLLVLWAWYIEPGPASAQARG